MNIYIEAGANDGVFQSRSLVFENNTDYYGILIEPIPQVFEQCKINRPKCKHYNCALVDFDFENEFVELNLHRLHYAMAAIQKSPLEAYSGSISVPARTLDSILSENNINVVDSFFLDVEGYELNVLKGIDFDTKTFKMIEIECHYIQLNIDKNIEILSHVNYLSQYGYVLKNTINDDGNLKLIFTK